MKAKYVRNILSVLSSVVVLAACGDSRLIGGEARRGDSSGKQKLALPPESWLIQSQRVNETVTVFTRSLTTEGRSLAENEVKETALEPLNLPSTLNVNAFTIKSKGNTNGRQSVFIAPKLYFYQKKDGAEVQVKRSGNLALIPLHAILVDGLSPRVPRHGGIEMVELPESYRVDLNALKEELVRRGFDESVNIGPLDGCAKSLSISVAGHTYDVTPEFVANSDYCEINRPFAFNLVVPADKADFIVNDALYLSEVDASAAFQVIVGYLESDTHIQLDRSKVYQKLEASLKGSKAPYVQAEVRAKLRSIVQTELINVFIKGERNDVVESLVNLALESFKAPFELKPDESQPGECSAPQVCIAISYDQTKESRNLEASYQQYSTTLTTKTISSFAKPQQILFPETAFDSAASAEGQFVDNREGHHNERYLAQTVSAGSVLELQMISFKHELDNTHVVVETFREDSCARRKRWPDNGCEDWWQKITVRRSYAGVQDSEPKDFAGNILGNPGQEIFLKFTRSDGSLATCSLNQLRANAVGTKYIVKIENTPDCGIFRDENNKSELVSVNLINHLRDPNPLKAVMGREPYQKSEEYVGRGYVPQVDLNPYGGAEPARIVELPRAIKLQMKVLIRKYTTTVL